MTKQLTIGDDEFDQVCGALEVLDRSRMRHYARTGDYRSLSQTEVFERARKYMAKMPPAVSGQRGRATTWNVAMVVVHDFGIEPGDAVEILIAWNLHNVPPWTPNEIQQLCWRASRASSRKPTPRGWRLREAQR
jgi:hypothetical protein